MKHEMMNTINLWLQRLSGRSRSAIVAFVILAMCATTGAFPSLAQQSAPRTFPSATEASQSLFQAVQRNDEQAIENILGGSTDLASSQDEAQDKLDRELFVQKYQEMHRLGRDADGSVTLYIGAENWPFPIPLVEKNGAWHFDSDAGLKEVLFRRIGRNELTAIATCHEFVADEKHYGAKPNTANPTDSSPASLVARAASHSAGGDPVLFHGYYFRLLATRPTNGTRRETEGKTTGAFALIAYPAAYRSSGVMTFIVTETDIVYEKDLGADTSALARAMTTFHKDATWHVADE
jgi:Protein of unknown function (DUF2950)